LAQARLGCKAKLAAGANFTICVTLAGLRDTDSEKTINNQWLELQIFCHPTDL
jgi:hypothetical protein